LHSIAIGRGGVLWGMQRIDPKQFDRDRWFAAGILVREEPEEDEDEDDDDADEEDDDDNQQDQDDDGDEGYSE
jgi:hypothetical protein